MSGTGRPLRFLGLVAGGWVAARVVALWYLTGSLPMAVRDAVPLPRRIALGGTSSEHDPVATVPIAARRAASRIAGPAVAPIARAVPSTADPIRVQLGLLAMTRFGASIPIEPQAGAMMQAPAATPAIAVAQAMPDARPPMLARPRLTGSSWLIARGGVGFGSSADAPQLGGTQGGVRLDYALGRGLAVTARAAAPAAGAGREVSLGLAWQPAGVPLRFVAERRVALDRGRGGPALGVSGGVSQVRLPADFRLESYGQAGAIFRDGVERYVDGIVRAARPVATAGGVAIDAGAGAWGGAQRGVARLDVGPSLGARLPIAGRTIRVAIDWRQRVAGNARPGSGPALSVGSDF